LLAGCTVHSFPPLPIYILKSERLSYSYLLTPLMYVSTILKETFSSSIACFLKWWIFPQFTSTISANEYVLCIHSFTVHTYILLFYIFSLLLSLSLFSAFFSLNIVFLSFLLEQKGLLTTMVFSFSIFTYLMTFLMYHQYVSHSSSYAIYLVVTLFILNVTNTIFFMESMCLF
jgi:hypothetical protein